MCEVARKHRLRRICERKPSGKLNVPLAIHEAWRRGGIEAEDLMRQLEEVDFKKVWPLKPTLQVWAYRVQIGFIGL